ncbi:MAG TPA: condensation domain-containing protein, partial [Jatrophihabitans sp.]|nr:condensation domain-containing protein [Jatrophihabitans sp.]
MTAGSAALGALADPERYRALPVQCGMVVNNLRYPDDGVDVLQITLDWTEPVRRSALEQAWQDLVSANPVLRTGFESDEQHGLVQVVGPDTGTDVRWQQLNQDTDEEFEWFLRADRRERFAPSRPPLIRLTLVSRPGQPVRRAVLTFHHALLDGRSMRLLVEQLTLSYAARLAGRAAAQPTRPPFRDFVKWWQMVEASDSSAAALSEAYWTDQLAGPVLPRSLPGLLPLDRLGAEAGAAEPRNAELALTAAESDRIRQAAQLLGLNASTLLTAAWALLRARYGGVDDVVLAVTRSCRPASIPDADQVVGLLINTVPLRVRIDPAGTVEQLLHAVNDGIRQLREHQLSPMASILGWAGLPVDTPLIDSLMMFDRRRLQTGLAEDLGLDSAAVPVSARVDRLPSYPLTVLGYDEPRLLLGVIWDGRRFSDGAPQLMLEQVRATLLEFAARPGAALADLSLAAPAEPELIEGWNRTGGDPAAATIAELFAEQVRRQPTALAVQGPAGQYSYAELDQRSDRLARALRRHGVGTGSPVAVALPRGLDLIVALL